jgi:hypothetical protein
MRIEGSRLESLLAQAGEQQHVMGGPKEVQRGHGGALRPAQAATAAQAQSALSVHLSSSGQALSAVVGSAGLVATGRTQGSSYVMDVGGRGGSNSPPLPQLQTIRRIVEQATGKQLSVLNGMNLGPVTEIGGPASPTDPAAAIARVASQLNRALQYAASGTAMAADGANIGFSVSLTLESRLTGRQHINVQVSHVGSVAAPKPEPEVQHAGPVSDLQGHTFVFDLGVADADNAEQVQVVGSGKVVFDQTKMFSVQDLQAALRSIKVI